MRGPRAEITASLVSLAISFVFLGSVIDPSLALVRALLGSLLLVYILGLSLRCSLRLFVGAGPRRRLWTPAGIALDLFVSLAISALLSTVLALSFRLDAILLITLLVGTVIGLNSFTLAFSRFRPWRAPVPSQLSGWAIASVGIVTASSALVFLLFRAPNPYPSISGWDLNATLATVGWVLEHHGFAYVLMPPFPISALIPYPASFSNLVAGYSLFLGVEPLSIFYYGVFVILLLYGLGVFAITYRLSNRVSSGLVAALVLFCAGSALPTTVRTPLFLTIDMVGQLAFLGLLLFFLDDEHILARRRAVLVLGFGFLIYWYFYEIVVLLPFLALMLGEATVPTGQHRQRLWFRGALALTLFGMVSIVFGSAIFVPSLEPSLSSSFPLIPKVDALVAMYAPVAVLSVPMALARRGAALELPTVRGLGTRSFLEYLAVYLAIYLLPLSATYRVEFYFRLAVAILVGTLCTPSRDEVLGALRSIRRLSWIRRTASPEHPLLVLRLATYLVLASIVLMAVLIPLRVTQQEPYMSQDEYQASVWIGDHTASDAYIVTYPGSGYVVRDF